MQRLKMEILHHANDRAFQLGPITLPNNFFSDWIFKSKLTNGSFIQDKTIRISRVVFEETSSVNDSHVHDFKEIYVNHCFRCIPSLIGILFGINRVLIE